MSSDENPYSKIIEQMDKEEGANPFSIKNLCKGNLDCISRMQKEAIANQPDQRSNEWIVPIAAALTLLIGIYLLVKIRKKIVKIFIAPWLFFKNWCLYFFYLGERKKLEEKEKINHLKSIVAKADKSA